MCSRRKITQTQPNELKRGWRRPLRQLQTNILWPHLRKQLRGYNTHTLDGHMCLWLAHGATRLMGTWGPCQYLPLPTLASSSSLGRGCELPHTRREMFCSILTRHTRQRECKTALMKGRYVTTKQHPGSALREAEQEARSEPPELASRACTKDRACHSVWPA